VPGVNDVKLAVYDLLGREVAVLVNERKAPGSYEIQFSAKGGSPSGGNGRQLASGVYFCRMTAGLPAGQAGSYVASRKMLLIR
jgi:hypothetical protein